jgi:hypothetical protein
MRSFPFRLFLKEFLVILSLYLGFRLLLFFLNSNEMFSPEIFFSDMLGFGVVLALAVSFFRVLKRMG